MTPRAKLFWSILLLVGLAVLSFGQVPPVPVIRKSRTTAATQGSGATALLSVKAAAIPTPVYMQVSWTKPINAWTQMVYPKLTSNGVVVAWSTNRLTNMVEVSERVDGGAWTVRGASNQPPIRFTRSTGRVQMIRARSFWQ